MNTIYNNTFLNSLFTSDEFNFIKHLDSNNEEFTKILESEKKIRDIIVNLINGLNDSIRKSNINHENSSKEVNMLSKSQSIFETVNSNISMLQINEEISNNLNKEIIDLLIKVEADESNSSESKFIDEITNLKTKIADFSNVVEDMKKTIIQNDFSIQKFINNADVQEYFRIYSIKFSNVLQDVQKQEQTKQEKSFNIVSSDIIENNNCLLISETKRKVFLPYSKQEVLEYIEKYPTQYTSFEDVTTLKKLTISFEESGVFSGTLTNGGTITGTWEADGKNRTVFIDGKNIRTSGNLNGFDNEFVQILKDAAYYQGDSRNLLLAIEKRTYYVQLSHY